MTRKQVFKRIKNGQDTWLTANQVDGASTKFNFRFDGSNFILYSYDFTGNDEWAPEDDVSIRIERTLSFSSFEELKNWTIHACSQRITHLRNCKRPSIFRNQLLTPSIYNQF